jgi:hypothetical protein
VSASAPAQLWRPREGDVIEGVVVAQFGRWPSATADGSMGTIVLQTDAGERVHVPRAFWARLERELKRERPRRGDRIRIERRVGRGGRRFRVARVGAEDRAREACVVPPTEPRVPRESPRSREA